MGGDVPTVSAMSDEPDHRRQRRPRVLKGATIILGVARSEIACTMRNQHPGGAELKLGTVQPVPERFLLYVPIDGVAYRCVLRWRDGVRLGVEFEGTEPKPKWHYG